MADIINKALYSFLSKLNRPCIILLLIYAYTRLNFLIFLKSWHLSHHSRTHSINENIIKKKHKTNQKSIIWHDFSRRERILITARARAGNFALHRVRPFKKVSGKFLETGFRRDALRCESHTFVTESSWKSHMSWISGAFIFCYLRN